MMKSEQLLGLVYQSCLLTYWNRIGCFGKPTPGIKEQLLEDGFDRLLRL